MADQIELVQVLHWLPAGLTCLPKVIADLLGHHRALTPGKVGDLLLVLPNSVLIKANIHLGTAIWCLINDDLAAGGCRGLGVFHSSTSTEAAWEGELNS